MTIKGIAVLSDISDKWQRVLHKGEVGDKEPLTEQTKICIMQILLELAQVSRFQGGDY